MIDKLTLDAMVQGQEVAQEYWDQLLREPEAGRLWFEAVERRKKIDRYIQLVSLSPQTARLLKLARRSISSLVDISDRIVVDFTPTNDPLSNVLGSEKESTVDRETHDEFKAGVREGEKEAVAAGKSGAPLLPMLAAPIAAFVAASIAASIFQDDKRHSQEFYQGFTNIAWNTDRVEEMEAGASLSFQSSLLKSWHYHYLGEDGWLRPEDAWHVDIKDGPVVLSFFSEDKSNIDWEDAMKSDCLKAILTIIPIEK